MTNQIWKIRISTVQFFFKGHNSKILTYLKKKNVCRYNYYLQTVYELFFIRSILKYTRNYYILKLFLDNIYKI